MSQTTLTPSSRVTGDQLGKVGGGTYNWSTQTTNDGDISFVYLASSTEGAVESGRDRYVVSGWSATGVSSIVSVTGYIVCRKADITVSIGRAYCALANSVGAVAYGTVNNLTTSYATYSYTWATNPFTSSAWTVENIASTQLRLALQLETDSASGDYPVRCTQSYAVVEWRPLVKKVTISTGSQLIIPSGSKVTIS